MFRRTLTVACACLLAASAARAEDLLQIHALAVQHDPQWRGAQAALAAGREAGPQGLAQILPTASLSASTTRNDLENRVTAASQTYTSKGYTLSVSQPVFRADNFARYRQADSQVAQAEAQGAAAEQDMLLRVAQRYFDELAAADALDVARAERTAIERQLEQAKKRFEVGLIAITDVHEAQAGYDLSQARAIAAENALDVARAALSEVTGQTHGVLKPLKEDIPLITPEPRDLKAWVDKALAGNLSLIAAQHGADVARENISRARSGHLPTLDLTGSMADSESTGGNFGRSDSLTKSVGLQFALPLFAGGATASAVRQAEALWDQAKEAQEQARRAAERAAKSGYLSVQADISRVTALKQALVSADSALKATEAGFEVGTRTIVDVLTAQQNLYRARGDYLKARYDYLLNTLRLKLAAGTLATADLQAINGWLQ